MIFKKPYGFLIKHFRLVHLIITAILVYLVLLSNQIYKFLNDCIMDSVNRYNALEYIDYRIYIWLFIVVLLFIIIYWLFKYKDKPRNMYFISILGYLLIGIYTFLLFSYLTGLPYDVIDQKVIRSYRDITLITLGFQYLIIVIMFIRGLGFDIKKFNFSKDFRDLELTNEDNEEVELDLSLDTTSLVRSARKKKRELGYFYKEYKLYILGIIGVVLIIVGYSIYNALKDKYMVYHQGEIIGINNFISINDSYYKIDDEKKYIVLKFDIFKNGLRERLDVNKMVLVIDGDKYIPNKNICYNFDNIGNCYKKQYITNDSSSYILVYDVDVLNLDKAYFMYKESYDKSYKVKLELENYE